jgi:hypothetical protein
VVRQTSLAERSSAGEETTQVGTQACAPSAAAPVMPDFVWPRHGFYHTIDSALASLSHAGVAPERITVKTAGHGWQTGRIVQQVPPEGAVLTHDAAVELTIEGEGLFDHLPTGMRALGPEPERQPGIQELASLFDDPVEKVAHYVRQGGLYFDVRPENTIGCSRLVVILLATMAHPGQGTAVEKPGADPDSRPASARPPETDQGPSADEAERRNLLRKLQMQYDSERDPVKKISYARQISSLLDPYVDFEKIRVLQTDIKQLEQAVQELGTEQEKQQAMSRAKKALAEKRYKDAEQEAARAVQIRNDTQTRQVLTETRTRLLVEEAKDALTRGEMHRADDKNHQALQLAPNDPDAQKLQGDINNSRGRRKTVFVFKLISIVCLIAGLLVGLYILLRPRPWVLQGIDGACKGQVFALDKDEVKIGALGLPDGQ